MLRRITVGLADEGVSVTVLCSPMVEAHLVEGVLGSVVVAPIQSNPIVRPFARRLAADALAAAGVAGFDVVHALGGGSWHTAAWLAEVAGAPLMIDLWRTGVAMRLRRTLDAAAAGIPAVGVLAPGDPVVAELRNAGIRGPIRTVAWGVHAPRELARRRESDRAPAVGFVGRGADARQYHLAFDAACRIAARKPSLMLFADAETSRRLGLWPRARAAGVAERLTLVSDFESRRGAALAVDVLVQPEARGEHRSVLLDAMGQGVPVVAAADRHVVWLIDRVTCRAVTTNAGRGWEDAIEGMLDGAAARTELTAAAFRFVREKHPASGHIAGIIDAYESLVRAAVDGAEAAA